MWPWSYGSWIYNYLCNQYLSPLMLWVRISIKARCTTLCDKVFSYLRLVSGFLRVSGFLLQQNWPPQYNWNIVESGVKHHQTNIYICEQCSYTVHTIFFYKLSGEPVTVEGTVMDLNQPKKLKDVISLVPGNVGFDHCFCFSDAGWKKLRAKWVQCNSRNISLGLGIEIRANVVLTWVFNQIIEQKIWIVLNLIQNSTAKEQWESDCCLMPNEAIFQLYHGENMWNSMKLWWCLLCTRPTCLIGSLSC